MSDQKIFYNLSQEQVENFKSAEATSGKIGFVQGTNAQDFGYIVANGKQYGASKEQITSLVASTAAKVSVDEANSTFLDKDGNEITLAVDENGKLSFSKYIAAKWGSLSLTQFSASKTDASVEYGSTYTIKASVGPTSGSCSYSIIPGTETISNRIIVLSSSAFSKSVTPTTDSGSFTIDEYSNAAAAEVSKTGIATEGTTITCSSGAISVEGKFVGSKVGELTTTANAGAVTATATLTVKYRWVQHNDEISVSATGTLSGSGLQISSNGTVNYVTGSSKPSSFTCTEGDKCYLLLKNSWGTPKFADPGKFTNDSWKENKKVSVYDTDDYTEWVFIGTDGNPASMNAAGAGTWTISF